MTGSDRPSPAVVVLDSLTLSSILAQVSQIFLVLDSAFRARSYKQEGSYRGGESCAHKFVIAHRRSGASGTVSWRPRRDDTRRARGAAVSSSGRGYAARCAHRRNV